MAVCTKMKHKTEYDASEFHWRSNNKPCWIYRCPYCFPDWHISLSPFPNEEFKQVLVDAIQSGVATLVKRVSGYQSIFDVEMEYSFYRILYSRRGGGKIVELIGEKIKQ